MLLLFWFSQEVLGDTARQAESLQEHWSETEARLQKQESLQAALTVAKEVHGDEELLAKLADGRLKVDYETGTFVLVEAEGPGTTAGGLHQLQQPEELDEMPEEDAAADLHDSARDASGADASAQ